METLQPRGGGSRERPTVGTWGGHSLGWPAQRQQRPGMMGADGVVRCHSRLALVGMRSSKPGDRRLKWPMKGFRSIQKMSDCGEALWLLRVTNRPGSFFSWWRSFTNLQIVSSWTKSLATLKQRSVACFVSLFFLDGCSSEHLFIISLILEYNS